MSKNTTFLKNFLEDVGHSVHCMNTIAVALSQVSSTTVVPSGLNISWKPGDVDKSALNSRRFAIKSAIVYSVESLFEYLSKVSKSNLWNQPELDFNTGNDAKAVRVVNFFDAIPNIDREWVILAELLCHWRNKVVHASSSNASISNSSKQYLLEHRDRIYTDYHHFDVQEALSNFDNAKFTLKDVSTLITMVIKCVTTVDDYFVHQAALISPEDLHSEFSINTQFSEFLKLPESDLKTRKLITWLKMNASFLSAELITRIAAVD